MTRKHTRTLCSLVAQGIAALAATPAYAGEYELQPPDIKLERTYISDARSG